MARARDARGVLVARAFVLGLNGRAALAVLLVAMSVGYAVLAGSAVGGLQGAGETIDPALALRRPLVAQPGLAPFPAPAPAEGRVVLVHADTPEAVVGTVQPWPYGRTLVRGPYAPPLPGSLAALGLPLNATGPSPEAPWTWILVPPDIFAAQHPSLAGMATMVVDAAPAPGPRSPLTPAGGAFYDLGAEQVYASLHLLVLAMGLTVAVFAGGVLRLETLARQADLAALEALGGAAAARRAVLLRATWLVGLGVGIGLAGGAALGWAASIALHRAAIAAPPWLLLEVGGVAFAAGLLAGGWGSLLALRAPLARRLGGRTTGARRFPGPVRFLLVTPRLAPAAFAAALVLASISTVVLAAANVPVTIFEPEDGTRVIGRAAGNPFRGSADRFFGEHATLLPGVDAASPETLVPTVIGGRPVVVRGVALEAWQRLSGASLLEGHWAEFPGEATVGVRLRGPGLAPGDEVVVPGAYRATARLLRIVGVHAGAELSDDELVTDLDTAGDLAGLAPEHVHFIRLKATDDAWMQALAGPVVLVTDLSVDPPSPVPRTQAVAVARVVNLASVPAARSLALRVDGVIASTGVAQLDARGEGEVRLPFRVPDAPFLALEVNPSLNVSTASGGLRVVAPETVGVNTTFRVEVRDDAGGPVAGADVTLGAQREVTDAAGVAQLLAKASGPLHIEVRAGALRGGALSYAVEAAWALSAHLALSQHAVTAAVPLGEGLRYSLALTVVNLGGAPFQGAVEAFANGTRVGSATVSVAAREEVTVEVDVLVPRGTDEVEVLGATIALPEGVATPERPGSPGTGALTVAEALAARRAAAAPAVTTIGGSQLVDDLFATLEPSVSVVLLATLVHSGAGLVVAVLREVRERQEVLRTLLAIGAPTASVAGRAARDAIISAGPPIVAGAAVGAFGLHALQPLGFPAAFGHTIPLGATTGVFAWSVASLVIAAALAAASAAKTPPSPPLRQAERVRLRQILEGFP